MNVKEAIIYYVSRIPYGRITNYGHIADCVSGKLDKNISAQLIGRQLTGMNEEECKQLPRRRVVAKSGAISSVKLGTKGIRQIELLEKEKVPVVNNAVPIDVFGVNNLAD